VILSFQNSLPNFMLSNFKRSSLSSVLVIFFLLLAIGGCASKGQEVDPTANWSVEKLFQDGTTEMNDGNYKDAGDRFISIEARFPFGPFAQQDRKSVV
jgi:outer membrane protein assembly factor BamD